LSNLSKKLEKAGSEMEVKKVGGGGGLPPEEPNAVAGEEASKCAEEEISANCNGRRMWEVWFYRLPKSRHTRRIACFLFYWALGTSGKESKQAVHHATGNDHSSLVCWELDGL